MTYNHARNRGHRGMSLVELMIVVGVLGVIFAAVFFFFTKGMEQFHFSRRQNELSTAGRLALEQITDEIIWAGYLPHGGIDGDLWHPVHETDPGSFTFYADYHAPWGQLDDDEYRTIFLGADNTALITDKASMQRRAGYNITSVQFVYMDEDGDELSQPLSLQDRDAVRHIRVTLVLQDTYMGDIYTTTMRTTISPQESRARPRHRPHVHSRAAPFGNSGCERQRRLHRIYANPGPVQDGAEVGLLGVDRHLHHGRHDRNL